MTLSHIKVELLIVSMINDELTSELIQLYSQKPEWVYRKIDKKRLFFLAQAPSVYILTMFFDNHLIGAVTLSIMETVCRKVAVIEELIIDEKFRGKGYGKHIMKKIDDICKDLDIDLSQLTVRANNFSAAHLYLKNEYRFKSIERFMIKEYSSKQ